MRCSALGVGVGGWVEGGTGDLVRMRSCRIQAGNLNTEQNPSGAAIPCPFLTQPGTAATQGILPAFRVPTQLSLQRTTGTQALPSLVTPAAPPLCPAAGSLEKCQ